MPEIAYLELGVWWDEPEPIGLLLDANGAVLSVVMPARQPLGFAVPRPLEE